jgi:hypothetical protein
MAYVYDFGKRKDPCGDCWNGHCTMNCGPAVCAVCGAPLTWQHDHRADNIGIDDGPPLCAERKKPPAKSPDETRDIRARAWATRRQKYGQQGHR